MSEASPQSGERVPWKPPGDVAADEALEALVPYKNPPALWAYYLGLFGAVLSCVPFLGLGLCMGAVVTGSRGLRNAERNPELKGKAHAWFGLIAGGIGVVVGLLSSGAATVAIFMAVWEGIG